MNPRFPDHFSGVAGHYADRRPRYPAALFAWLASQCADHGLAWDCGAGSGQASSALAQYFRRVIASDASEAQIAEAEPHPGIEYRVAAAEQSGLDTHCADLVVVAQALHWFDLERFYPEARRVLKPHGVIAAWCYGVQTVEGSGLDAVIQSFYADEVGSYWPPERRHVETAYRELEFPFRRLVPPAFTMHTLWTLDQLLGYFRSWSATARFIRARGVDPVDALEQRLLALWGAREQPRLVEWPLAVLAGTTAGI